MAAVESDPWWRQAIFARTTLPAPRAAGSSLLAHPQTVRDLPFDALIVPAPSTPTAAISREMHDSDQRIVVELDASSNAEFRDNARAWLDRGAAGLALHLPLEKRPGGATVTSLFGESRRDPENRLPTSEIVAGLAREYPDRLLAAWNDSDAPGSATAGVALVFETSLRRCPWRSANLARLLGEMEQQLGPRGWPAYILGAPLQSPFLASLGRRNTRIEALALLLTLRGSPCIEVPAGNDTGLEENSWKQVCGDLMTLRREQSALNRGSFRPLREQNGILGYLREFEAERLAVLLNLGRRSRRAQLPAGFRWTLLRGPRTGQTIMGAELTLAGGEFAIARAGTPTTPTFGGSGQRRATSV